MREVDSLLSMTSSIFSRVCRMSRVTARFPLPLGPVKWSLPDHLPPKYGKVIFWANGIQRQAAYEANARPNAAKEATRIISSTSARGPSVPIKPAYKAATTESPAKRTMPVTTVLIGRDQACVLSGRDGLRPAFSKTARMPSRWAVAHCLFLYRPDASLGMLSHAAFANPQGWYST